MFAPTNFLSSNTQTQNKVAYYEGLVDKLLSSPGEVTVDMLDSVKAAKVLTNSWLSEDNAKKALDVKLDTFLATGYVLSLSVFLTGCECPMIRISSSESRPLDQPCMSKPLYIVSLSFFFLTGG